MKIDIILEKMLSKIMVTEDVRSLNILLEGDPSTGKSYKCEMFAKEKGLPFVSLSLPTLVVEQASGIPFRVGDKVVNSKPSWMDELGENGILLLDEFNAADDDTQKIFLSLLSERRINSHLLGKKVMIIAAQNDFRQVNNYKMSPAVLSRFAKYNVSFDYGDWRNNYLPKNLNDFALHFLDELVEQGFSFSSGQDFLEEGLPTTARSVERWLIGADEKELNFLLADSYSNMSLRNCTIVKIQVEKIQDVKSKANDIFTATESVDYDIRLTSKKKRKEIYEI